MKQALSIVIPTYNGLRLLQKNLTEVFAVARDEDEVVIVDDASQDQTVEWLVSNFHLEESKTTAAFRFPSSYYPSRFNDKDRLFVGKVTVHKKNIKIQLLSCAENRRFGASANLGVLLASYQYVFLCNNDVIPQPGCLEAVMNIMENEKNTFAVGCLEYLDSISGEKSGKNRLWFARGLFQHSKAAEFSSGETAWASGGSALFNKEKWLELGGFDKAYYPAYWEDIDISFRARKKNWKVLFSAEAIVFHKHESTNTTVFGQRKINRMSWKNAFTFTLKNGSFLQKVACIIWMPYWFAKMSF